MKPLISTKISTNFRIGIRNFQLRKLSLGMLLIFLIGMQIFVNGTTAVHADALLPGCNDLIRNGSFEEISADWVAQPSTRPPAYVKVNPPLTAVDGVQVVRLGIVDQPNIASNSQIEQIITLPTNTISIVLSYRYYTQYNGGIDAGDYQYVSIYNVATGQLAAPPLFQELRNDRTWLLGQFNLQQFAGMQLRLVFGVNNDGGSGTAGMYVDNVSLTACTSTPTPIPPTVTNTPIPPVATWTPVPVTATPTPIAATPIACEGAELLLNGGFETNDAWYFGEDPLPGQFTPLQRHSGNRSVLLGNLPGNGIPDHYSYSSVRQLVTIPANATTAQLRWWHLYGTEDPDHPHVPCQQVILLSPDLKPLRTIRNVHSNEGAWNEDAVDLSDLRGQSFYIYFNALNDGDGHRTWMYIDDVSVRACFPSVNAPVVAPVTASGPLPTEIPLGAVAVSSQAVQVPDVQVQVVQPAQALAEVPTATGAAVLIEPLGTVVEPAANVQVAASAVLQGGSDVVPLENTPTPASPSLWERLFGAATSAPEPTTATPASVGFDRLGTVAVLLGILVIIALLASAIVRMLRGR